MALKRVVFDVILPPESPLLTVNGGCNFHHFFFLVRPLYFFVYSVLKNRYFKLYTKLCSKGDPCQNCMTKISRDNTNCKGYQISCDDGHQFRVMWRMTLIYC
jgi:hypothetical protein